MFIILTHQFPNSPPDREQEAVPSTSVPNTDESRLVEGWQQECSRTIFQVKDHRVTYRQT